MARTTAYSTEQAFTQHLSQVFNYMSGGVALSGVVAYLVSTSPLLLTLAVKGNIVFMLVWLAFGFFMHSMVFRLQPVAALAVFGVFATLTGFSLAPLVLMYTGASIVAAFATASVMFAGASAYGYYSKKSLSGWGTFLMMGSWGLLGLGLTTIVLGLFGIPTGGMSFAFSLIAVPLFAGITAWEVNTIRETFLQYATDNLLRSRLAILSACSLYMNFVTMFINLLQLMGDRR
ncbi:MAG: Bax inhibitor-1/YccA family protein [Alphaproteobacteria bacterium]